jgi:hypothetical protein
MKVFQDRAFVLVLNDLVPLSERRFVCSMMTFPATVAV